MFGVGKKSHEIDMLSGPLLPKILLFAIPLALSSILQLLFNAADVIVLGRYVGEDALAAVGSTTALINLLINLFVGLSVGVNVLVAQHYAKGDRGVVSEIVHTAVATSLLSGFGMIFVGYFASAPLLEMMGTPENVLPLSALYMRIYFAAMPFVMLYNFGAAILRAVGDTRRPLYYLLFAGVVNVVLNLYFVVACDLGVAGVALATAISNLISSLLVLHALMTETSSLRLYLNRLRIQPRILRRIFTIGLPAGLQGCIFSLSNTLIQSSVNSFGYIVMAGSSAASNIEGFIYNAMNAVYQANLSFTSQNIGAGKYSRVGKILKTCLLVVTVIGAGMGISARVFGVQLLSVYNENPDVIAAGLVRLTFIAGLYFLCGWMDVLVGSLRGMGYAMTPMIVSLVGACGLRILWIFTIFAAWHDLRVLFVSYPITWIVTAGAHFFCYRMARKRLPAEDEMPAQSAVAKSGEAGANEAVRQAEAAGASCAPETASACAEIASEQETQEQTIAEEEV